MQQRQIEISRALASMADARKAFAVLAIPDTPESNDEYQDALLEALYRLRPRRSLLVWRSVLAVLAELKQGMSEEVRTVGVIGHSRSGLTTQKLKMRHGALSAPERRETGREYKCAFGLDALLEDARNQIKAHSKDPTRASHIDISQNVWKYAFGLPCETEPVRRDNGEWELIPPLTPATIQTIELPPSLISELKGCDLLLLDTPLNNVRLDSLNAAISAALDCPVHNCSPDGVARGALEAARRLAEKQPVYYDFLPQISTIVQESNQAVNYGLIPRDALLPAGTIFRSDKPAQLGLQAGSVEIEVYLLKEGNPVPRRAIIKVPRPPSTQVPVTLSVEQAPASGRAKLILGCPVFSGPVIVDWDRAEELEKSWNEILESLEPTLPTVPNRLVLPCGMDNWESRANRPGLHSLLAKEVPASIPNWDGLANKISNRPYGLYSVSSDGDLPATLSEEAVRLLEKAIDLAEADVRTRLDNTSQSKDNHSLRFLTWLFQKCPEWVVQPMIDALDSATGKHVFVRVHQNRTLMLQGLGRIARKPEDQRLIFDHLLREPQEKWKKNQMACAAFLLSRTDSAPRLITSLEVEFIGDVVERKLREAIGQDFTVRYSYGPFLLVGLLRRRLAEPWALVAGRVPLASRLLQTTQELVEDLASRMGDQPHLSRYHTVLVQVCDELSGHGSNPNILVDLERLTREVPNTDGEARNASEDDDEDQ